MRPIRAILSDAESDSIFPKKLKFLTRVSKGGYHRRVISVTEAFRSVKVALGVISPLWIQGRK